MGKKPVKKKPNKLSMRVGMTVEFFGAGDCEKGVRNVGDLLLFLNAKPFYDLDNTIYTFQLIKKEPIK